MPHLPKPYLFMKQCVNIEAYYLKNVNIEFCVAFRCVISYQSYEI